MVRYTFISLSLSFLLTNTKCSCTKVIIFVIIISIHNKKKLMTIDILHILPLLAIIPSLIFFPHLFIFNLSLVVIKNYLTHKILNTMRIIIVSQMWVFFTFLVPKNRLFFKYFLSTPFLSNRGLCRLQRN